MPRTICRVALVALLTASSALLFAGGSAAQSIDVALTPDTTQVNVGDEFDLDITVTDAGLAFNGYDAVIAWDPAALTFVSSNEGTLMTDACSNTFYRLKPGADRDTITDVLLCSGVDVTGPGQLYHFRFKASNNPQTTQVTFQPGLQFYDAGLFVGPAFSTDATVDIVTPVGVGSEPGVRKLSLSISPNPARTGTTFTVSADRAGLERLRVVDARGQLVRRFESWSSAPGMRAIAWDGLDTQGKPSPSGVYLVTLELAGRAVTKRVCLIR